MAGFRRQTGLARPVGMTRFRTEQIVLVDPEWRALEDLESALVVFHITQRIALVIAVGMQQRGNRRATELLHPECEIDRFTSGVVDRTGKDRAM